MKRYELMVAMMDNPEGEWVRADDPAITAAVEAMEWADELLSDEPHPSDGGCLDTFGVREKLRLALADLKEPRT